MSWFCLDGRFCEGSLLDPLDDQGRPQRLVYAYKSPEGNTPVEWRVSNSIAWVDLGDDGSGWTHATMPRGAVLAVAVYGQTDLREVHKQLVACHARREQLAAADQGGASHGEPSYDPTSPFNPGLEVELPLWQKLGFKNEDKWRKAGSPTE